MSYAAIVTLVLVGVLVVALAGYLLTILVILLRIGGTLGKVASDVRTIADRTQPIGPAVEDVHANLSAGAEGFERLGTRTGVTSAAVER